MSRPKFVPAKEQDFTSKIAEVLSRVPCAKHEADIGEPCFVIYNDDLHRLSNVSICGKRSKMVFDGAAKPKSFGNKRPTSSRQNGTRSNA